jgi:hypothetical protein
MNKILLAVTNKRLISCIQTQTDRSLIDFGRQIILETPSVAETTDVKRSTSYAELMHQL